MQPSVWEFVDLLTGPGNHSIIEIAKIVFVSVKLLVNRCALHFLMTIPLNHRICILISHRMLQFKYAFACVLNHLAQVALYEPHYERTDFCICVNKGADQLRSNCGSDQRLYFHFIASMIPLLPKYKISSP